MLDVKSFLQRRANLEEGRGIFLQELGGVGRAGCWGLDNSLLKSVGRGSESFSEKPVNLLAIACVSGDGEGRRSLN